MTCEVLGEPIDDLLQEIVASPLTDGSSIDIRMLGFDEFGRMGIREARANFASDSLLHTQMKAVPATAHVRMRRRLKDALSIIQSFEELIKDMKAPISFATNNYSVLFQ